MTHPRHQLDDLLNAPVRFSLAAALASVEETDFRALRDALEVSDSLLSQHIKALEDAGYVRVRKGFVGKRPRTWLSLADPGRKAFTAHYDALRTIASNSA